MYGQFAPSCDYNVPLFPPDLQPLCTSHICDKCTICWLLIEQENKSWIILVIICSTLLCQQVQYSIIFLYESRLTHESLTSGMGPVPYKTCLKGISRGLSGVLLPLVINLLAHFNGQSNSAPRGTISVPFFSEWGINLKEVQTCFWRTWLGLSRVEYGWSSGCWKFHLDQIGTVTDYSGC